MKWSFYNPETGLFTGRVLTGSERAVEMNTPTGLRAIPGSFDHRKQRVDIETGEVVAYDAPQDSRMRADRASARIAALERRQARPMRELSIDPNNAEARRRLLEIEAEIATLREYL